MKDQPIQVVMVGDCAWVGETLIRYSPQGIKYQHLKRTRSLYSKTFGIALSILRSKGDLYHVHYGLQDHFITKLLKRQPTVCHLHGSDVRHAVKGAYGWIVRQNLRTADRILVAVPDILAAAKSYRPDAEYVPNPVNLELFKPKPLGDRGKGMTVLFASALSFMKGAQRFVRQYSVYQKVNPDSMLHVIGYGENRSEIIALMKELGTRYKLLAPVPHHEMAGLYHGSDVVVTDFRLGYLHMTSLEAMACYRPVVQYIDDKLYANSGIPLPPVVRLGKDSDLVRELQKLTDRSSREKICREQKAYIDRNHNPTEISRKIARVYHEVVENRIR